MTPEAFASPAFMPMGKLSAQTLPCSISQLNEGRGLPNWFSHHSSGVVTLLRRAEDSFHFWVVIEERKEDGNTFDDGSTELRLDAFPIVLEPSLHGFELRKFFGIGLGGVRNRASSNESPYP